MKEFCMFAGYGGSLFALKKAKIEHECVGFSEIDKYAIQCFNQNFPNIKNYGDCRKINPNELPDFDLLTAGFPCQSFSQAGKMLGEVDPRGTLFYEIIKIAEVKKPKYMLLENVKGLTSKKFKDTFDKIISELRRIGYYVHWKVLNSKDFGIPQSRARVWFVCFRDYPDFEEFKWIEPVELKIFIKDILEENVDSKYYLSEKLQERFSKYLEEKNKKLGKQEPAILDLYNHKVKEDGTSITLSDPCHNNLRLIEGESKIVAMRSYPRSGTREEDGDRFQNLEEREDGCSNSLTSIQKDNLVFSVQLANKNRGKKPYDKENREMTFDINKEPVSYTIKQAQHEFLVANCIKSSGIPTKPKYYYEKKNSNFVGNIGQLRKLTPKECFRLMGFLNDEINLDGLSDTQRYKLAGNGWEINLASKILKEMLE